MSSPPETGVLRKLEMLITWGKGKPLAATGTSTRNAGNRSAQGGGPLFFTWMIGKLYRAKGLTGLMFRATFKGLMGIGGFRRTNFHEDLGQADCLRIAAAPLVLFHFIFHILGAAMRVGWRCRRELMALAVATSV